MAGKKFTTPPNEGFSASWYTFFDTIRRLFAAVQSIKTIKMADATNNAGAQALANAAKEKINQILVALGASVQEDDDPLPEEAVEGTGSDTQVFDAGGSWTKPAGFGPNSRVLVQVWAGGGGGGTNGSGGGGGGGGYNQIWLLLSQLGASEPVTVGAGGAADNAGGTSSFGAWCTAYGGGAGISGNSGAGGGGGIFGAGANGSGTTSGTGGAPLGGAQGVSSTFGGGGGGNTTSGVTGDAVYGGGGGGKLDVLGGNSLYGGGGGGSNTTGGPGTSVYGGNGGANGVPGQAPGGGGGRNASGADGRVIVTVFI